MKPRIRMRDGLWCIDEENLPTRNIGYIKYMLALNFCIRLNNRK